jgi:hypothetical protein
MPISRLRQNVAAPAGLPAWLRDHVGVTEVDGAALRGSWDAACERADAELRRARVRPEMLDDPWLYRWCNSELGAVAAVQAAVDGKRWRPGTRPSGLMREFPVSFDAPAFRPLRDALEEVDRLFRNGLDSEWDWSRGFPRGWRAWPWDRLRAYFPWYDT